MVRKHQPHVLIDNRLETSGEGFGSIVTADPYFCGDFASPEQIIPPEGIATYLVILFLGTVHHHQQQLGL